MSSSTASSATDVDATDTESPRIEALFLIRFDKKIGYTIAWKRTTGDISLDNAVEYKALPSGLHALQSDLVYFTHQGYAGLSAFARGDASAAERNANFVSVGVLARRDGDYGRLGRGWLLAGRLEKIAAALAEDADAVTPLEEFWEEQTMKSHGEASGGKGHSRVRAISTVSAVTKEDERLPAYHPALSMLQYIDVFGPLVFRLQQAALLRKRILFVGSPPVRAMCEFVYILSILSSLSARDSELLIPGTESLLRLPTLFSIGVHDIPSLEGPRHGGHTPGHEAAEGWAACTTDEIITTKTKLYDIIVEMPQTHDTAPQQRRWPRIRTSDGHLIKASHRDVARYKMLHKELFKHRNAAPSSPEPYTDNDDDDDNDGEEDTTPLISRDEVDAKRADDDYNDAYDDSVVEPTTWSRLAYHGFMWWASAGERDANTTAERDTDRELIGDLGAYSQSVETAVIAYFHRQSSHLIQQLSRLIEADEEDGETLVVSRDELGGLGLDTWSEADRAFVWEFGTRFFGRGVEVGRNEVECCGLRVPVF